MADHQFQFDEFHLTARAHAHGAYFEVESDSSIQVSMSDQLTLDLLRELHGWTGEVLADAEAQATKMGE